MGQLFNLFCIPGLRNPMPAIEMLQQTGTVHLGLVPEEQHCPLEDLLGLQYSFQGLSHKRRIKTRKSAARNWKKVFPQTKATTFAFFLSLSFYGLSLIVLYCLLYCRKNSCRFLKIRVRQNYWWLSWWVCKIADIRYCLFCLSSHLFLTGVYKATVFKGIVFSIMFVKLLVCKSLLFLYYTVFKRSLPVIVIV